MNCLKLGRRRFILRFMPLQLREKLSEFKNENSLLGSLVKDLKASSAMLQPVYNIQHMKGTCRQLLASGTRLQGHCCMVLQCWAQQHAEPCQQQCCCCADAHSAHLLRCRPKCAFTVSGKCDDACTSDTKAADLHRACRPSVMGCLRSLLPPLSSWQSQTARLPVPHWKHRTSTKSSGGCRQRWSGCRLWCTATQCACKSACQGLLWGYWGC